MGKSIIQEKSFRFARLIIEVCRKLQFVNSRQLLRSGTSVGANVEEALAAQNRRGFLSKMAIASKEVREARAWLLWLRTSKLASLSRSDAVENGERMRPACCRRRRAAGFVLTNLPTVWWRTSVCEKFAARRRKPHARGVCSPLSTTSFRLNRDGLLADVEEIIRILTPIVQTTARPVASTRNSKLKTQN